MTFTLAPIVEGQSEDRAIGVLLRRLLHGADIYDCAVAKPFRVKRNRVVREGEFERTLTQVLRSRENVSAVLVLLDADKDCPAQLGPALVARASVHIDVRVAVVLPKAEIEAWILAAIESVRGVCGITQTATAPAEPEEIRDAKGALSRLMEGSRGYVATADQPTFFSSMDLALATSRAPSFAKLQRDLTRLVTSTQPSSHNDR